MKMGDTIASAGTSEGASGAMPAWGRLSARRASNSVSGSSAPATSQSSRADFRASVLGQGARSEEHTSELQSLMRISYAVFCLKKKTHKVEQSVTRLRVHQYTIH